MNRMNDLTPEEALEAFISLVFVLLIVSAMTDIYSQVEILDHVIDLIKLMTYLFIFVFVATIISKIVNEL